MESQRKQEARPRGRYWGEGGGVSDELQGSELPAGRDGPVPSVPQSLAQSFSGAVWSVKCLLG